MGTVIHNCKKKFISFYGWYMKRFPSINMYENKGMGSKSGIRTKW